MLWSIPYIVEILTPRRRGEEPLSEDVERFARRYTRAVESGCAVSIPDNPLGNPRFSALETFEYAGLKPEPERTLVNLNTFHSGEELHALLTRAAEWGLIYLLVVRGDGSPELPRLQPGDLGMNVKMVTSVELILYIGEEFGETFQLGAAFNQYKPESVEFRKAQRKREAGSRFFVTQPVLGSDGRVSRLMDGPLPVIVEAWMSRNIGLFLKSVKAEVQVDLERFDPRENLVGLHEIYPARSVYLSMLDFSADWKTLLPKL